MKIYLDKGRERHLKFEKLQMLHGGGSMLTILFNSNRITSNYTEYLKKESWTT